ncbi:MAG: YfhO family protein [Lachnospiraceae bacterium]|nr:YfhO family protein [Lachnospiraceae bacterium]
MKIFTKKIKNIYLLSFCIPVLGMLWIFVARGIFPFGNNSFMFSDMYHQYVPFLTEFWRKLHEGESMAFSWYTGLGSNFVAVYSYYLASPFNWLAFLFPENLLIEFMTYFIVLKIGLCGLTFSYYLSKRFQTKDLRILWFSVFYAMSGFVAAYNWNHMWLDVLWLAPLVILGLEELVKKGRCRLYCLTLAASIFTNYYLSIMLCIFLVLYFLMQLFTNGLSWRIKIRAVLHFTVSSLLAGAMAGVLLVPVMNAMHVTDFHDISFPKKIEVYFNGLEMLARHAAMLPTERGLDHWPNIYCGVLAFILVPVYIFHKRIPLRQKIGRLLLLTFMLLGFSVNILNFIWHGLNYPDSLPARQSFLYIFVILTMCFEAVYRDGENGIWNRVAGVVSGLLLVTACGIFVTTDGLTIGVMTCTWLFLAGYLIMAVLFRQTIWKKHKKPMALRRLAVYGKWAVLVLVTAEAGLNMAHTSVRPVQRGYYMNNKADYEALLTLAKEESDVFYRFESLSQMTKNDGTLTGYPSASVFSSTINGRVEDYYDKLGMGGSKVSYYYSGSTPLTGALLGVRYTFSEEEQQDTELYEFVAQHGKKYLYRNKLTLPVGFVMSEELMTKLAEEITKGTGNPIVTQNNLIRKLGIQDTLFANMNAEETETEGNQITVRVLEDGHLYGVVFGNPEGDLVLAQGEETQTFSDVGKGKLLDLGWFAAGEEFTITADESEALTVRMYRLSPDTLKEAIAVLGEEPFLTTAYTADSLEGTVTAANDGYLVMSVPYEPGWEIFIDGKETEYEMFADTMIAVPVTSGKHTVSMRYSIHGTGLGLMLSIVGTVLFILIYGRRKRESLTEPEIAAEKESLAEPEIAAEKENLEEPEIAAEEKSLTEPESED